MTTIAEPKTQTKTEPKKPTLDKLGRAYATGRRKKSTARVWIKRGSGKVTINKKDFNVYFGRPVLRMIINQIFDKTSTSGQFDVNCTVTGGGLSGQAGAILHGIARAMVKFDPESYHKSLRKFGFLTRDSRSVERKKPGRKKARKSFQFSKR